MTDSKKRKEIPDGDGESTKPVKKSKGGNGGKWKMPHNRGRVNDGIEEGDRGIFVTCTKNKERRATTELLSMFEECAQRYYGMVPFDEQSQEQVAEEDIEASIRREAARLSQEKRVFVFIRVHLPCVFFVKTPKSIDPVDFVYRICKEVVVATPTIRRMRYVHRLTPMTLMGKTWSKEFLEEIGKPVIGKHLQLAQDAQDVENGPESPHCSYAIRGSIRANDRLAQSDMIKRVASLVGPKHKVNLTKPDKVILIEICTTVCGMSVVNGDWEALKRFSLTALYTAASNEKQ